jgi:hypothetical protein
MIRSIFPNVERMRVEIRSWRVIFFFNLAKKKKPKIGSEVFKLFEMLVAVPKPEVTLWVPNSLKCTLQTP